MAHGCQNGNLITSHQSFLEFRFHFVLHIYFSNKDSLFWVMTKPLTNRPPPENGPSTNRPPTRGKFYRPDFVFC